MASIQHEQSGVRIVLESQHLVGRSALCTLQLPDEYVSSEHASLRWNGQAWIVRDLGSLNGTQVDGVALNATEGVPLQVGSKVSFGGALQTWIVLNIDEPSAMAVPLDGGVPVVATAGLLALPSAERPLVTVHCDSNGAWQADWEGTISPVFDRQEIQVEEQRYRLCLPKIFALTKPLHGFGKRVAELALLFKVSRDLEHIELEVSCVGAKQHLKARTHNEILLVLARARARDAQGGLPPQSCGWVYQDQVCRDVALDPDRLYVDIYRVRRQFAELGVLDPAQIVERRSRSKQIRIGTANLSEQLL